ncbi:MAG: hypothetical protein R3D58_14245 [Saprospiraceae bacterium]
MLKMLPCSLFTGLLLFSACKKDLPPPVTEDPVFKVDYILDNQPATRTAGLNNVYLFTNSEKGADEVWQFTGSFAPASCPAADCPGTLTFILRNYTQEPVFDSTWNTGVFPMYQPGNFDSTVFRAVLDYNYTAMLTPEVSWLINNQAGLDGTPVAYETTDFMLDVGHSAQFPDGLAVQSRQLLYTAENLFCLRSAIRADLDSSGLVTFSALPEPVSGNYTYAWSTGDTLSSFQTDWLPGETYTVTVSEQGGGCTASVSLGNLPDTANTYHSGLVTADVVPLTLKTVGPIFERIDDQGLRWRSDGGAQPFPAYFFELLEVLDYDKNENGLPTKKLRIRWKCRLYNDAGDWLPFEGSGVVAVGWPG